MIYIECPDLLPETLKEKSLFLAGGITDCPNWQRDMVRLLKDTDYVIINPRRVNFPIDDPSAAKKQIHWEFIHLRLVDKILFWFPRETLCPIVLYELGFWNKTDKSIFIGVHPDYQRLQDVAIQTKLARPEIEIVYSLEDLAAQVRGF